MVILINNSLITKMFWSVVSRPFHRHDNKDVLVRGITTLYGEVYDKPAFFSYYDDTAFHVWNECQVRTHAAASFVHIWFNWTLQNTEGRDLMLCFANSVRAGQEWLDRKPDWWRLRLVQFVFRALALRDEFLALNDLHQMHGNYNNEWARKKMINIAMTWTEKYRVHGAATSERTRSVLRLVWQHWFGSKDFALLVAAEGVMDWKKIVASLSHICYKLKNDARGFAVGTKARAPS